MKTSIRIIYWIPRILCILAILFVITFALDSFSPGMSFWRQAGSLLLHLVPSLVLIIFLIVAWKRELIGGVIFLITGLGFMPLVYMMNFQMNHSVMMSLGVILMVNFPFILAGILFIISHFLRTKN